jgi:hypothetical protein
MKTEEQITKISFVGNGKVRVDYTVFYKKKPNGKYICYMPGFNHSFTAHSENDISIKADAMNQCFFDYYAEKNTFDGLILQLHRLGFRSPQHNYVMDQLLRHKKNAAKMTFPSYTPDEYADANVMRNNMEVKMAA